MSILETTLLRTCQSSETTTELTSSVLVDWLLEVVIRSPLIKEMFILPMEETGSRPVDNKPYQ